MCQERGEGDKLARGGPIGRLVSWGGLHLEFERGYGSLIKKCGNIWGELRYPSIKKLEILAGGMSHG